MLNPKKNTGKQQIICTAGGFVLAMEEGCVGFGLAVEEKYGRGFQQPNLILAQICTGVNNPCYLYSRG
jgi:hypothetical protein